MRIVTKKGVEITVLFELFGHIAVSFVPMAVPLSLLFAMIYTLNRLSEDSEIVAIRAMGINKFKLLMPFLLIGAFCAVSVFSLNRNLIPYSKRLFKNTVIALTSKGFLSDIKAEQFYTEIPNIILFAEGVENKGENLENVFIQINKPESNQVIMAKKGHLIKNNETASTALNLRLDLFDGNIVTMKSNEEIEKILFEKYEFPIVSSSDNKFVNKESMKSNKVLLQTMKETEEKLKNKDKLSKVDLDNTERSYYRSRLEYWTRFNVPVQCLVFVLLGFVFGVKKGRGHTKNTSVKALLIVILYYILFFGGISMAKKGKIPSHLAVFLPTAIVLVIASRYYKNLDWQS